MFMASIQSCGGWLGMLALAALLQNCTQTIKSSTFELVFDDQLRVWGLKVGEDFQPQLPPDAIELVNDSFGHVYEKPVGKQGRIEVSAFVGKQHTVEALTISVTGLPGGMLVQEYKLWKKQLDQYTESIATGEFGEWVWSFEDKNQQIILKLPPERTFFIINFIKLR
jgi:hypothetical protein